MPPIFIDNSKSLLQRSFSGVSFPSTGNTLSILDLMKISDITILYANYRLIYHISVPLIDHEKFVLYKVSPLPTRQNNLNLSNTFAYIWPESHYLAVNIIVNTYIPITLDKINKCKNLDDKLICKETEPIQEISQNKFIAKKNVTVRCTHYFVHRRVDACALGACQNSSAYSKPALYIGNCALAK